MRGTIGYKAQLESPEWAAFSTKVKSSCPHCAHCRRSDRALSVHHVFYDWKRMAWEYSPGEVIVLCDVCHREMGEQLSVFRKHVFGKLNSQSFKILNGALLVALTQYDPLTFCHALCDFVSNKGMVERFAKAWSEK